MNHIEESAELYALGLLEPAERDRVDEHLASCTPCTQRVGEAERAVAALVDATHAPARRRRFPWPLAVAAAFALSSAALVRQNLILQGALSDDGAVYQRLVTSHFLHEQFQTPAGVPLDAKAVYERHGRWIEIIVMGDEPWHVTFVEPDGTRIVRPERFARRGGAAVITIAAPPPLRSIELDDAAGGVVGTVRPTITIEPE